MMILVSKPPSSLAKYWQPNLGILQTPRTGFDLEKFNGWPWACDNDAYSGFNEPAYIRMLEKIEHYDGCMWVTAPDVVGDSDATLDLFNEWVGIIDGCHKPVALVAQDGLVPKHVPWIEIDCLFIGGTTEWKLGDEARELVRVAKEQGKLVHMGRVNSQRRIRYAKAIGCDSVDGSRYAKFTDAWLPQDLRFAAGDSQTIMSSTWDSP